MNGERFTLDTSILIYYFDAAERRRQALARRVVELAAAGHCWLTLQAVSEFYAASTRKGRVSAELTSRRAEKWLDLFPCLPVSAGAVRIALSSAVGRQASYWDALLIATAAEGHCTAILTENMANGSMLTGVKIINPFGPDDLTSDALAVLSR